MRSSPVLWGVVAGLFRFIPYVGAWIAAALPLIRAAATSATAKASGLATS